MYTLYRKYEETITNFHIVHVSILIKNKLQ